MESDVQRVTMVLATGVVAASDVTVPATKGFYSWWVREDRLVDAAPVVPVVRPPGAIPPWALLYVGIAPKGSSSSRTLALRFSRDHLGGTIGQSTFRQSLAALLARELNLVPKEGYDRSRIVDERPLSLWIDANCGVSLAEHAQPWTCETEVIRELNPPLNLKPGFHPFRVEVDDARKALRKRCGL